MAKATRAIASARLLLDAGDVNGGCNRAYYAMFDAAHAALIWSGANINPAETKTHRGMIAAFGKHLVKPGLLSVDLGKSLNQVERVRLLADYTGEEVDARDAQRTIAQAELFVAAVQEALVHPRPKPEDCQ